MCLVLNFEKLQRVVGGGVFVLVGVPDLFLDSPNSPTTLNTVSCIFFVLDRFVVVFCVVRGFQRAALKHRAEPIRTAALGSLGDL